MRHKDNIGFPSVTVLVFPDAEYDSVACGGETMFFESIAGDAVKAVTPVGGRAVVFDGDVFHSARPPLPGYAQNHRNAIRATGSCALSHLSLRLICPPPPALAVSQVRASTPYLSNQVWRPSTRAKAKGPGVRTPLNDTFYHVVLRLSRPFS